MSVDVSRIKPGDDVTAEFSPSNEKTGGEARPVQVTGVVWNGGNAGDHSSTLKVGEWYLDAAVRIIEHVPARPEQPEWADALVLRWRNGAVWVRRGDGFWFWNGTGPYDLKYLSTQSITVVIDKDGNNVEAKSAGNAACAAQKVIMTVRDVLDEPDAEPDGLLATEIHDLLRGLDDAIKSAEVRAENAEEALNAARYEISYLKAINQPVPWYPQWTTPGWWQQPITFNTTLMKPQDGNE